MFLTPLAAFGLPQFWLKVFGQEGWSALKWLKPSIIFALISTLAVIFIAVFWAIFGDHPDSTRCLYIILLPFLLGNVAIELVTSKLQLEEKYISLAMLLSMPSIVRLGLAVSVAWVMPRIDGLFLFGFVYFFVGVLATLFFLKEFIKIYKGAIDLVGHGVKQHVANGAVSAGDVFKGSFLFGLAGSFHLVYFQGAVVLLAYLSSAGQAGIYNVAFLVMSAVYLFPNIMYQKFLLPKIHRWSRQNPEFFYNSFKQGSLAMLGLGVLACIAIWILMPYLLPALFGIEYEQAVTVVCLLSLCAPIRFMATSVGSVLVTQKHVALKVRCMAGVAIFSLSVNFILIPKFGIDGALLTTFFSELFLLTSYYVVAKKYVFGSERVFS